jgi:hypothetical protein
MIVAAGFKRIAKPQAVFFREVAAICWYGSSTAVPTKTK